MPEKLDFELSEGRPKMSSNAAVRLSAEAGSCEPYGIGVRDRLLTQTPLPGTRLDASSCAQALDSGGERCAARN